MNWDNHTLKATDRAILRFILPLLLLGFHLPAQAADDGGSKGTWIPDSWREDADLHDVMFVDDAYGWAVGDHGTIWHTQNGGEIWRRQSTKQSCRLQTVHFVDRQHGWAAGGYSVPRMHASHGVLLQTSNGGATWEHVEGLLLPRITGIHFSNQMRGIAVGHMSALYPTGAWSTHDGGKTWSPIFGIQGSHWLDCDFQQVKAKTVGLVRGHDGRLGSVTENQLTRLTEVANNSWSRGSIVAMMNANVGFAGSDTPLLTADGGQSWLEFGKRLPVGIKHRTQFRAMACSGRTCWLAGAPGNRILASQDGGQNWRSVISPSALPLNRFHFTSPAQGWVVGARGAILSTSDAGATWQRQRGGKQRYALLGIFADERDIPWDLLAQASAVNERRTHIILLASAMDSARSPTAARLQDAAMKIGATAEILTGARFYDQLDQPADRVLQEWESQQPEALEWLVERLTRIIRARRPDVVLSSERAFERSGIGAQRITSRLVADACEYAASDVAFADQFQALGLDVWNVTRVLACVEKRGRMPAPDANRTAASGATAQALAVESRRVLGVSKPDSAWTLQSLADSDQAADLGTKPFAGIHVEYGSAARRARTPARTNHRASQQLALALSRTSQTGLHRVEQLEYLAGDDRAMAGTLLFELAEAEADPEQRNFLLQQFLKRHEQHRLLESVLLELVQRNTSLEQQWREYKDKQLGDVQYAATPTAPSAEQTTDDRVQQASTTEEVFAANWKPAQKLMQEIKSKRPTLYAEPEIAFPLVSMKRFGKSEGITAILQQQQKLPTHWRHHARTELALIDEDRKSFDVSSQWSCKTSTSRPLLDGDLGDEIWNIAEFKPLASREQAKQHQTLIGFAKDDEYLYFAAYCPKRAPVSYVPVRSKRPRDADLANYDHIRLNLDINRDYRSWWTMKFDYRGWTWDGLNGEPDWNPKYYVAAKSDEQVWTVEVAIPLEELAPPESRVGTFWGIGVQRIVPETKIERWNGPSSSPAKLQGVLHLE